MLLIEFTDLTGYEDYVQYCRSNLISSRTTNLYYMTSLMEHLVLHYIKPTLMLKKTRTTESYKFEANHCIENHLLLLLTIKELYSFLKCYRLYRSHCSVPSIHLVVSFTNFLVWRWKFYRNINWKNKYFEV